MIEFRHGSNSALVQPEMERRRFPLVSVPPSDGHFQGIDTTTRLSLSTVAFPQSPLRLFASIFVAESLPKKANDISRSD